MRTRCSRCALAAVVVGLTAGTVLRAAERIELVSADDPLVASPVSEIAWEEPAETVEYSQLWTVWAGAIFLDRDNPYPRSLVRDGSTTVFGAGRLNFDTSAGPDLNAIRHGEFVDVDFRYFQVNGMSAQNALFPGGPLDINLADPFAVDCPQLVIFGQTSLQSVELNVRKNLTPNASLLAGFRYLSLSDDVGYRFDQNGDSFGLFTLKLLGDNRLYGAQAGIDANLFTAGRFQLQTAVKGGIYGNDATNQVRLRTFGTFDTSIGTRAAPTSFVGDVNFSGIFQINRIWAVRGGYQLLWLTDVALAADQHQFVSILNPVVRINTDGDLFLHGALVSLQAGW
jgi:hypothetical protein